MSALLMGVVVAVVLAAVIWRARRRQPPDDLGQVGPHWLAQHRSSSR